LGLAFILNMFFNALVPLKEFLEIIEFIDILYKTFEACFYLRITILIEEESSSPKLP
jgi:hypothetical protein